MIQANATKIPLPDKSVHCVITSPPYFGLRAYNAGKGEIGLESSLARYLVSLRRVFREVWRILRDDGVCWINLGDSYAGGGRGGNPADSSFRKQATNRGSLVAPSPVPTGIKPKDQLFVPHRVAMMLQADGWYCRSTIIWHKPSPMPESVTDRPTNDFEYVFLLAKQPRYFYDADAIREPHARLWDSNNGGSMANIDHEKSTNKQIVQGHNHRGAYPEPNPAGRNKRTVWAVATQPTSFAHFATFPPKLIEPMIKAGTSEKGCCSECGAQWERVVERTSNAVNLDEGCRQQIRSNGAQTGGTQKVTLGVTDEVHRQTLGWQPTCACGHEDTVPALVFDPFLGSGTTAIVARNLGRRGYGIDLSFDYCQMATARMSTEFGARLPLSRSRWRNRH